MTAKAKHWCVLIPCSSTETWAVPQNCLGEIVTVPAPSNQPPATVTWRGHAVPVVDLGGADGSNWRDARRGTGLVAVFLSLKGAGCAYWGVAVRSGGLRVVDLAAGDIDERPEMASAHATAAFNFNGVLCQVPDLDSFQKRIASNQ